MWDKDELRSQTALTIHKKSAWLVSCLVFKRFTLSSTWLDTFIPPASTGQTLHIPGDYSFFRKIVSGRWDESSAEIWTIRKCQKPIYIETVWRAGQSQPGDRNLMLLLSSRSRNYRQFFVVLLAHIDVPPHIRSADHQGTQRFLCSRGMRMIVADSSTWRNWLGWARLSMKARAT